MKRFLLSFCFLCMLTFCWGQKIKQAFYINAIKEDTISKQRFDSLQKVYPPNDITVVKFSENRDTVLYVYISKNEDTADEMAFKLLKKPLPSFRLKDINGNVIDSKTFAGKVVYINFWNTHCVPCVAEIPDLNRLKQKYQNQDVVLLTIAPDNAEEVKQYLSDHQLTLTTIPGAQKIFEEWHVRAFPKIGRAHV